MIKLGLTGSIGMGKSTVAKMFADEGIPVFDADAEVHKLQGPAGRVVAAIEARFPGTTGETGVNRTALAEAVLGDDGYAIERSTVDARDNVIERHYLGVNGDPVLRKGGYAWSRARYDDLGKLVETTYFDLEGRAVSAPP